MEISGYGYTSKILKTLMLVACVCAGIARSATVITTNTYIDSLNGNYDGADIVVSNCTVTVAGFHSFNSLYVGGGGVLTHPWWPSGVSTPQPMVTNELQILNGLQPVTLLYTNIIQILSVTDTNGIVTYSNGVDYVVTNLPNGMTQISATTNSSIPGYAAVFVNYVWSYSYNVGLILNVTNDITVASGGSINANGIGYGFSYGPGRGNSSGGVYYYGSGAAHGGLGGASFNNSLSGACYDSLAQPSNLGSPGGPSYAGNGGVGGGLVQLTAGGSVNVYGAISANGADATNSRAGGGSGGGIWITATNISGSGSITVNGGAGEPGQGGGGGGGRISIQCVTNIFAGNMIAYGGSGSQIGGAGTIYTQAGGQTGLAVVDNGGRVGASSTVPLAFAADVIISGGAGVAMSGSFTPRNLTVGTNSTLTTSISGGMATLNVTGNFTIQNGGTFLLDSLGFLPGTGDAPGNFYAGNNLYPCGGGGYGGYGGAGSVTNANGGSTYDFQGSPLYVGSGGGNYPSYSFGGYGGGGVNVSVGGTAQIDGRISANGGNGSGTGGGGGSGGSIRLICGTFAGAGSLSANGGNGVAGVGGGGGGGRIAVTSYSYSTFTGTLSAYGGSGANYGGAGTIYTQIANAQQLLVNNGGHVGAITLVQNAVGAGLVVQNGGKAAISTSATFATLLVTSNAWLTTFAPNYSSVSWTVGGNATFQAGGGFIADSGGFGSGLGSAPGGYSTLFPYGAGGGGHGGAGGNGFTNSATGGPVSYDLVSGPGYSYTAGAGGGYFPYSTGGNGGGNLRISVNGTLQLDGLISANGGNGAGWGGGGGAGGGIYLTTSTFAGRGSISANGGNGANSYGGGGGGGMIAVYFNNSTFAGSMSAFGGSGANWGGAGTIYLKTNSAPRAQLIVDNNGHVGGVSAVAASVDLTLRNGAVSYLSGSLSLGSVVVGTNASLVASNIAYNASPSSLVINAVNVTVQPGGFLTADLAGYIPNSGNGHGSFYSPSSSIYPCSGAGHGGYGANSFSNTSPGGLTYDTYNAPNTAGSGGGAYATAVGGNGGGVIQLLVSGNLQVEGTLSANGGNGSGLGGGGGSGGSLNLSCYALLGAGTIAANGGAGVAGLGGGGGGGMIAASFTSNLFSGVISAYGGGGAYYGGAGTVYLKTNTTSQSVFIVDNGGHRGSNTLVQANLSTTSLLIRNGGTAILTGSPQICSSLWIGSNAWLFCNVVNSGQQGTVYYTVNANAIIQPGGGISVDGAGYLHDQGPGHGTLQGIPPWFPCSGGGHGGYGGAGISNLVMGGLTYDPTTSSGGPGSGGGSYLPTGSVGGAGGGTIYVRVNGTLQMDGSITANGLNGSGGSGGGGSGGDIYLSMGSLAGAGAISANGGSGANLVGGGGGGGRIMIYNTTKTNSFTGTVTAYGGGGANYGGAGTIYYGPYGPQLPLLVLDNGNNAGTNTTFDLNYMDVIIQGQAVGFLSYASSWSLDNLTIHTNGMLTVQGPALRSILANNITIDAGGLLQVDAQGYGPQSGNGSGYASPFVRGGGSHGGFGGGNAQGGGTYDSILAPNMAGSGGANYSFNGNFYGGNGGGILQLSVNGSLSVNGRLSANGGNGTNNAGGGAGGSLNLYSINRLSGSGVISANGGSSGGGSAGGGGGGRIALLCNSNSFSGQLSARGGNGLFPGGAGTIYINKRIVGAKVLQVDNGGLAGTNTPLGGYTLPPSPFDLNISGAASVTCTSTPPLLGNLNLAAGSVLSVAPAQSSLTLAVQQNAIIDGTLNVDSLGFPLGGGSSPGRSVSNDGAGGGYGGAGGASSSGALGGITYGSAAAPVDFGSGGGAGINTTTGGSEGGGALRISVGGVLDVEGNISANGDFGRQDNSGGGSGGSVWISANTLTGAGNISAFGGDGAPAGGGGGGGGRIAIYAPTNSFSGITNVSGGIGVNDGQPGTIFISGTPLSFQVLSQTPSGLWNNVVSSVNVTFNEAVDPASVSAANFTVTTPVGMIPASSLATTMVSPGTVQLSFPVQNLNGNYTVQVGGAITDILGISLAQPYTNTFTISVPTISGTVSDTNGAPVPGVTVQPDGGLPAVLTDTNGNYSFGIPPGWNGNVTPSLGTLVFVPGTLSYTNVVGSLANQDFTMVPTISPTMSASVTGSNLSFQWTGISGVTYQVYSSTNLIDWLPYGNAIPGTNGPVQVNLLQDGSPGVYFRVGASN